jgi:thioredoxin-related protein
MWCLPAALTAVVAIASVVPAAPTVSDEGIAFGEDVAAAMRSAAESNRPALIYFYQPSCQWCLRMKMTTFTDRRVTALASRFVWVKVDVTRNQELAALAGVRGVPTLLQVDSQGRTLSSHSGYLTADQLITMLTQPPPARIQGEELEARLDAVGKKLSAATGPADRREAVLSVVEELAGPQPGLRTTALEGLGALGPPLWEGLVECLGDERLAVRAAAAEILAAVSGGPAPFDAFAEFPQRQAQAEAWRTWVSRNKGRPTTRPMTELRVSGALRPTTTSAPSSAPTGELGTPPYSRDGNRVASPILQRGEP